MAGSKKILGITGSFGYIGRRLLARLAKSDALDQIFDRVICTDIIPAQDTLPPTFQYHHCDIRDGDRLFQIFKDSGVNTVIHLAFIANPTRDPNFEFDVDVNGTMNVINACQKLGVQKLVVASSDCAYGFFEGTPDYLKETAPIRSTPGFPYSENKAKIEKLLSDFREQNASCSVVVLRPCMVMGPNANNTTTKSMKQPIITGVRGYDPIMQFVHEDDTAEAFYLAATKNVSGAFNLAADEGLRYSELAKELGKPFVTIPAWFIYSLVETLYRLRLLPFGKAQLDYIRYPLSMDVTKIQEELGFTPKYTSRQTLHSFLTTK